MAALGYKGNEDSNQHEGSEAGGRIPAILGDSGEGIGAGSDQGAGGISKPDADDGNGHLAGATGADDLSEQALSGETVSLGSSGIKADGVPHPFSIAYVAGSARKELEASFTISGIAYTAYEDPSHPGTAIVVGPDGVVTKLALSGQALTLGGETVTLNSQGVMIGSNEIPFQTISMDGSLVEKAVLTDGQGHVHTVIEDLSGDVAVLDGSITLSKDASTLLAADKASSSDAMTATGEADSTGSNAKATDSSVGAGSILPSATGRLDSNDAGRSRTTSVERWKLCFIAAMVCVMSQIPWRHSI